MVSAWSLSGDCSQEVTEARTAWGQSSGPDRYQCLSCSLMVSSGRPVLVSSQHSDLGGIQLLVW